MYTVIYTVGNFMPPAGSFALLSGGQARVLRGGLCGMCPAYVWRAQNTGEHLKSLVLQGRT